MRSSPEYLVARERRNAREGASDRRDHFWRVPPDESDAPLRGAHLVPLVRQRLDALNDTDFVGRALASHLLRDFRNDARPPHRHLRERHRRAGEEGRESVSPQTRRQQQNYSGPTFTNAGTKWTAVRRLDDPSSYDVKKEEAPKQPSSPARKEIKASLAAVVGESGLRHHPNQSDARPSSMVKDKRGRLVCHLTITAFSATDVAAVLADDGDVERMTLHEALLWPWSTIEERQVWSVGYASLLSRESNVVQVADSMTAEAVFEDDLPPPQQSTKNDL